MKDIQFYDKEIELMKELDASTVNNSKEFSCGVNDSHDFDKCHPEHNAILAPVEEQFYAVNPDLPNLSS